MSGIDFGNRFIRFCKFIIMPNYVLLVQPFSKGILEIFFKKLGTKVLIFTSLHRSETLNTFRVSVVLPTNGNEREDSGKGE